MRSPTGKPDLLAQPDGWSSLAAARLPPHCRAATSHPGSRCYPAFPDPRPGATAMAAAGASEMPAPRPPGFSPPCRRAGPAAEQADRPDRQGPGIAGSCPHNRWPGPAPTRAGPRARCDRDGDDPAGHGRARHSRHGDGLPTPGPKVTRRDLPAGLRRCRAGPAAFRGQRPGQAGYRRSRAIAAYWQAAAAQTKAWKTSW